MKNDICICCENCESSSESFSSYSSITESSAQEELILELLDNIPFEEERKKYFREILEDKNTDNSTSSSKRNFDFERISMKSIFSKKNKILILQNL